MNRMIVFLACLMCTVIASPQSVEEPKFSENFRSGVDAFVQGKIEEAREHFAKEIQANNPQCGHAYAFMSILFGQSAEYAKNIEYANKAISLLTEGKTLQTPEDTQSLSLAYTGRGHSYFMLGDSEKALEDYSVAIRIMPDNPIAYRERSDVYNKMGEDSLSWVDMHQYLVLIGYPMEEESMTAE